MATATADPVATKAMRTILVVDNLKEHRGELADFLTGEGYNVITAENREGAAEILESKPVDLAVVDVRLVDEASARDYSGVELARTVRPDIPKVIVTAYENAEALRRALVGAGYGGLPPVGWVYKSEGMEELGRAVKAGLGSETDAYVRRLLTALDAEAPVAVRHRTVDLGPQKAIKRIRRAVEESNQDLKGRRSETLKRIRHYHFLALASVVLGLVAIMSAVALVLLEHVNVGLGVGVAGLAAKVFGWMESRRHLAEQRRLEHDDDRLEHIVRFGAIIDAVLALDSMGTDCRQRLIYKAIDLV
jgi:CheY-like chemotaxis protein